MINTVREYYTVTMFPCIELYNSVVVYKGILWNCCKSSAVVFLLVFCVGYVDTLDTATNEFKWMLIV